ncbi:MAG: ATP-binding protein [Gammaproteobacteria bacterium]|nr:ATP-binding protein [Gammaproteobacteria bacterium]
MSAIANPRIGVPGAVINEVFPFHVAIDDGLQIAQVGSSMARIASGLRVGTMLGDSLILRRPHGDLTIETIRGALDQPFLLELRDSGVRLRGQFLQLERGLWLFAGSPWFDSAAEIEAAGLSLADYPVHDPMAELLMISQTQQIAMRDLREVNERLEQQREAVKRTERIYRDAIAAADAVAYHESTNGDRFEFIDAGISRLTGHKESEMTPALFRGMIIESIDTFTNGDPESTERPLPRRSDHLIRAKDGTERWLSEASIEVSDKDRRATGIVGILADITERKAKEAERERLSVELDTILTLSPEGFAAFDALGRLSYCNPSFKEMTGTQRVPLERLHFRALDEIFSELSDEENGVMPVAELEGRDTDEVALARPRRRIITRSLRRMTGANDELRGWVLFMRDVTREREIDRMKSEFLSIAAHELRTPMTSVRGFAELLLSEQYDVKMTREIAETIHRQSTLLVHIVNDLLDIARIEAGQGEDLIFEQQSVHELVQQTVDSLRIPDDDRTVKLSLLSGESPIVLADAKKTIQALTNVLSNAFKYSPDGGEISLSVVRDVVDGRDQVGIVVNDHGIGMDENEMSRLFERFYRADPSGAIPGTGLGMSLVREIVQLHDGRVEVSSEKGQGTIVTVFLPEVVDQAKPVACEAAT